MKPSGIIALLLLFLSACVSQLPIALRPGATLTGSDLPPAGRVVAPNLDQPPVPLMMKNPEYPDELQKAKMTGVVVVEFVIGPDGKVTEAHAISSPHPAFTKAAIEAIMQSVFQPGLKEGKPVFVRTRTSIKFDRK